MDIRPSSKIENFYSSPLYSYGLIALSCGVLHVSGRLYKNMRTVSTCCIGVFGIDVSPGDVVLLIEGKAERRW